MTSARRTGNRRRERTVEALRHEEDTRTNIPTAEYQSMVKEEQETPLRKAYQRRNRDLDPQLVWRGKDEQDLSDLVVNVPPLYIQEKVHPKALIADLMRQSQKGRQDEGQQLDMFADFNGLPEGADRTDFYQHDGYWSNRMILGDSLQVMASLAEREGLQGKVQCIYIDPPYGIRFNSNFQWSTTSRDVRDGNAAHITREPEQVKAFRDTWRDGIHSYLTYLRDRLTVARDLLADSGSVFVQIGDENVHRVRTVMDEVFGSDNFVSMVSTKTSGGSTGVHLQGVLVFILWYAKRKDAIKYRAHLKFKTLNSEESGKYNKVRMPDLTVRQLATEERSEHIRLPQGARVYRQDNLTSQSIGRTKGEGAASWFPVAIAGRSISPSQTVRWKTNEIGMSRLLEADRVEVTGNSLSYVRYLDDFRAVETNNSWDDIGGVQSRSDPKVYVVQSPTTLIQRCILMTTDRGDLVLDPTCGSGTTAYVAEQWGRRWITIDTSRVALALARARIMGARYPYYILADSRDGQIKEAELSRRDPSQMPTYGNVRQGFVYERVPHITLRDIANNAEIDVIYEEYQRELEPLRAALNAALERHWEEWEIPREPGDPWPEGSVAAWLMLRDESDIVKQAALLGIVNRELGRSYTLSDLPEQPRDEWEPEATELHAQWWKLRIARQKEIDASISTHAEYEYLYDKPYVDNGKVRVAGLFTVESISPHRVLGVDENGDVIDGIAEPRNGYSTGYDFGEIIIDNLRRSGVQQAHKDDRIDFTSLMPWPGRLVCAEGKYIEGATGEDDDAMSGPEKRAGIFVGPEFGTVSRPDLVEAAREAAECGFDVLIACAFNYDAHTTEFESLGRVPVLKARMNADLHMAGELKNTGNGNLFVIFGEPDIDILEAEDDQIQVRVNGVDVFHPNTGEVRSDGPDGIACWFIDTDYDQESFFVRHAYFLGASDPYRSLKTTLKAEIDADAWDTLNSDTSRPFPKPETGRIAVKVINHLGDEVMKVFRVG